MGTTGKIAVVLAAVATGGTGVAVADTISSGDIRAALPQAAAPQPQAQVTVPVKYRAPDDDGVVSVPGHTDVNTPILAGPPALAGTGLTDSGSVPAPAPDTHLEGEPDTRPVADGPRAAGQPAPAEAAATTPREDDRDNQSDELPDPVAAPVQAVAPVAAQVPSAPVKAGGSGGGISTAPTQNWNNGNGNGNGGSSAAGNGGSSTAPGQLKKQAGSTGGSSDGSTIWWTTSSTGKTTWWTTGSGNGKGNGQMQQKAQPKSVTASAAGEPAAS